MAALAESVKNTQNTLGKIVTRPALTEKLLKKPPFRFLHDVISVVIKETGALKGLYNATEMKSDNIKDRDGKIKYLEKAISCVSFATGTTLTVKPGKVVAGQEPEKTNEFLQALAKVISDSIDTKEHVQRVLNGEKPGKPGGSDKENTASNGKPRSRANSIASRDRSNSRDAGRGHRSTSREGSRRRSTSKEGSSRASTASNGSGSDRGRQQSALNRISEDGGAADDGGGGGGADDAGGGGGGELETLAEEESTAPTPAAVNGEAENGGDGAPLQNGDLGAGDGGGGAEDQRAEADRDEQPPEPESDRPKTSRQGRMSARRSARPQPMKPDHTEGGDAVFGGESSAPEPAHTAPQGPTPRPGSAMNSARPRTGRLKSARPPSARPAAPRLKEKTEALAEEEMQARPQTGKVANVILAGDDDDDDDGDEFLVQEKPKDQLDLIAEATGANATQADTAALQSTGGEEHGGLVQQILETQKELTEKPAEKKDGGVEIERDSGLADIGRKRDRESTQREVDKLRESIQTLTRSANPLGKLMDFLQEDVDAMQRELDTWRQENKRLHQELKHEQKLTEQSIEPLKIHLADLETAVQEQLDKISVVKANIIKNDDRIQKLIGSIGIANR